MYYRVGSKNVVVVWDVRKSLVVVFVGVRFVIVDE